MYKLPQPPISSRRYLYHKQNTIQTSVAQYLQQSNRRPTAKNPESPNIVRITRQPVKSQEQLRQPRQISPKTKQLHTKIRSFHSEEKHDQLHGRNILSTQRNSENQLQHKQFMNEPVLKPQPIKSFKEECFVDNSQDIIFKMQQQCRQRKVKTEESESIITTNAFFRQPSRQQPIPEKILDLLFLSTQELKLALQPKSNRMTRLRMPRTSNKGFPADFFSNNVKY